MSLYIKTTQEQGPDPLGSVTTQTSESIKAGAKVRAKINAKALAAELERAIEGEVRFDSGGRALYAADGSNYRQVPIGVVIPNRLDDVVKTVALCRKYDAPLFSRGGGTSLAGQSCNVAVVMDFSKYLYRVTEIDAVAKIGTVEPGCVLDRLREEANQYGLTFGPDPATHTHCTLGGMTGNNSCGTHSQAWGRTSDNIEALEILTYDGERMWVGKTSDAELEQIIAAGGAKGEIYAKLRALRDRYADKIRATYPHIPRRISGYNLDELLPENGFNVARALVGSEGTLVTILQIKTNLVENPKARSLLVLGYPSIYDAADHIMQVSAHDPIACEGIDHKLIQYYEKRGTDLRELALLPEGEGFLILEFGGASKEESDAKAKKLMDELRGAENAPQMKLYDDPDQEREIWDVRESSLGATAFVPGQADNWPGWEDSAVAPEKMANYLRDLNKLFERHGYNASLYGHLGNGCIHCRIPFDLLTHEGLENYRRFMEEATDLVVSYGGSLSGEHGDGQSRAEFLPKMFGEELMEAMREFKAIWDPRGKMNPGKVVDAYSVTENLRLGTTYNPPKLNTFFKFAEDRHDFSRAVLRCVGVGKCRREKGEGTMCPSYIVTREEKHSTRGRARLLFEMLNGDELKSEGWKSEAVKEALDLCLACKGCKGDCPVNVDMATYKAEFLGHYYEGRRRPRHAYAFGVINKWAQVAAWAPDFVNLLTHLPGLAWIAKRVAGIDSRRHIPAFAPQTFRAWFRSRPQRNIGGTRVILWADTFNNNFHPTTAQAAVEVLEDAGFQVVVPMDESLCCGRPLYDFGFMKLAERYLRHVLDVMRPEIRSGAPMVVLEPSCWSTFADEMINLFPADEDAKRLKKQTFLLADFLAVHAPHYRPPRLRRKAIVHGHCHHKSVGKMFAEEELLRKMGLDIETPETGCCGMAGAFGFESGEHFEVAQKCGERVLLPAVRGAGEDVLIVADGFSCREQVKQNTKRVPLHLAQVMQMAMREGENAKPRPRAERDYVNASTPAAEVVKTAMLAGAALGAIGCVTWCLVRRYRK